MATDWKQHEDDVRRIASLTWRRDCLPEEIAGVAIDGVLKVERDSWVLLEITERDDLQKVREDITKLMIARTHLFARNIYARCLCVIPDEPTPAMYKGGAGNNIEVVSVSTFSNRFFDKTTYHELRSSRSFGSTANPYTGEQDNFDYIPVRYFSTTRDRNVTLAEIAETLKSRRKIVLLGDYGTGKSRCVRELYFRLMTSGATTPQRIPISLDLRNHWGLKSAAEVIRRHFSDLGMSDAADSVIRALPDGVFYFLLDGFDEIGSQSWSEGNSRLQSIRRESLEGVRDLIQSTSGGVLISGRQHYFNSDKEMYAALGLEPSTTEVIRCPSEFDETEMRTFLARLARDIDLPSWLPRRPLICQVVATLEKEDLERLLAVEENDSDFWSVFIDAICTRESRIRSALDPASIRSVLRRVARFTRDKGGDVGPVTKEELNRAFERAVGTPPVGESALLLQRLPGLGRLRAESDDRQFIDVFVLDGLRAEDMIEDLDAGGDEIYSEKWTNPLRPMGQRIVAAASGEGHRRSLYIRAAHKATHARNKILGGDLLSSLLHSDTDDIDFQDLKITDTHITCLDLTAVKATRFQVCDSVVDEIHLPTENEPENVSLERLLIDRVYGVSAAAGLPAWATELDVATFQTVQTTSGVRSTALPVPLQILVAIVHKTFFQRGAARKEASLLRGFGDVDHHGYTGKVVRLLTREQLLERIPGDEGALYKPARKHSARMKRMLDELSRSKDPIWQAVATLEKDRSK